MPKLFSDRTLPALCPFCRAQIRPPVEVEGGEWHDFAAGSCTCGAVFAHDPTARNGGRGLFAGPAHGGRRRHGPGHGFSRGRGL